MSKTISYSIYLNNFQPEVLVNFSINQQCPETLSCGWLACKFLIMIYPKLLFQNRNSEHVHANLDASMCLKSDLSVRLYVRVCVSVRVRFGGKPTYNFCGMQFQSLQSIQSIVVYAQKTLCHVNSPQTEALNPRNDMPRLKQEQDKKNIIQVIDTIIHRPLS